MNILSPELLKEIASLHVDVCDGKTTSMLKLSKFYREGLSGDDQVADELIEKYNERTRELYEIYARKTYYAQLCKERGLEIGSREEKLADKAFQGWLEDQHEDYEHFCEKLAEKGL